MIDIEELLRHLVEADGSDLHLKVGSPRHDQGGRIAPPRR